MTEQETYLFDLQGFLVVENALTTSEIATLDAIADRHVAECGGANEPTYRLGSVLQWGEPYLDLIDHPEILPRLDALMGPDLRLDHVNLDIIRYGLSPIGSTLHGGSTPFDPTQYYHVQDGRMHSGLTTVAFNLRDVGPDDGGFACVPASHKSNFPLPPGCVDLSGELAPFVSRVTGPAGTAIIFTEALTHGPLPWSGSGERRTIFYKYSPHPIAWAAGYPEAEQFSGLTERQKKILEAPNARYKGRKRDSETSREES